MKLPTTFNLGTALLAGLCTLLVGVILFELLPGRSAGPATKPASVTKRPALPSPGDDFNLPPLQSYREIVERPLFVQTRRPVASEQTISAVAGQPDASLNQLSLNAVVVSSTQRIALFRNTADKKTLRVEEGKQLQGWTLKEVLPESVTLAREGQEQKFVLVRKTPDAAQLQALRAQAQARKVQQARARVPPPQPAVGMPGMPNQRPGMPPGQQRPGAQPPVVPPVPPGTAMPPAAIPPPVAPQPIPQANLWH